MFGGLNDCEPGQDRTSVYRNVVVIIIITTTSDNYNENRQKLFTIQRVPKYTEGSNEKNKGPSLLSTYNAAVTFLRILLISILFSKDSFLFLKIIHMCVYISRHTNVSLGECEAKKIAQDSLES